MKIRNLFLVLFAAIFAFTACDDTDNPVDPTDKPIAPTSLQATSKNESTVILRWTASTSESNSLFDKYVLTVTGGANPIQPFDIAKGTTSAEISGLNEGTIYTFSIVTKFTDGTTSSTSAQIQWAPATRFVRNQNDQPIQVYESASNFGSGLVIFDPIGDGPKSATVSNGAQWNLGLDTRNGKLVLASARLLDYNFITQPGVTEIASEVINANSLDVVFDSQALEAKYFQERSIDLTQQNSSFVIIVRFRQPGSTQYNYAKVLVKYNNGFLQGSADNRYVAFEISYQKQAGVPYAKTPSMTLENNNAK
ncbi:MAG: fibronectin type III domain-containing protein [Chloroherpetonaceae bacterium]|nr:fibronectin type III domain-containing protein [bacterium]